MERGFFIMALFRYDIISQGRPCVVSRNKPLSVIAFGADSSPEGGAKYI